MKPPATIAEALAMAEKAERLRVESDELTASVARCSPPTAARQACRSRSLPPPPSITQASVSRVESSDRLYTPTVLCVTRALHDYSTRAASDLADARKETP